MKVGDKVIVKSTCKKYGGAINGCSGIIKRNTYYSGGGSYGVEVTGRKNTAAESGLYWIDARDLIKSPDYGYGSVPFSALKPLSAEINNVIFNDPATIVFWSDGSKTVVKCSENDTFDPMTGLSMAICKKVLGDNYKKTFRKWMPKEKKHIGLCENCKSYGSTHPLARFCCTLCVLNNYNIFSPKSEDKND